LNEKLTAALGSSDGSDCTEFRDLAKCIQKHFVLVHVIGELSLNPPLAFSIERVIDKELSFEDFVVGQS
jgi:hypothetical protein